MRFLYNITALCLIAIPANAADRNPAHRPYQIPVIKADDTIEQFTVDPDPDGERMLFCVEFEDAVLCIAEKDGKAQRYSFTVPGA